MKYKLVVDRKADESHPLISYPSRNNFLVNEKLNKNNIFDFIEYESKKWLIDANMNNVRSIYLMHLDKNEFSFSLFNPKEGYDFQDDSLSIEDLKDMYFDGLKNDNNIYKYFDLSLQDIQTRPYDTMRLFNTVYTIIVDNHPKNYFYFRADSNEKSRVKLYHTIARFMEKENDDIEIATIVNEMFCTEKQYNMLEQLGVDMMTRKKMFSEVEHYTYYIFNVK